MTRSHQRLPHLAAAARLRLIGAIGVSLLLMAAGIRASRPSESTDSMELADATDRLRSLRPALAALVDRDAEAYTSVIAALRMPATTDEEARAGRPPWRQRCAPQPTSRSKPMRACRRALREAPHRRRPQHRQYRGDVGVAIELLRSAVRSAGLTIDANLASLKDAAYTGVVKEERQRLDAESAADAEHGLSLLSGKSG